MINTKTTFQQQKSDSKNSDDGKIQEILKRMDGMQDGTDQVYRGRLFQNKQISSEVVTKLEN